MINEREILDEIQQIMKKTELLANPLYMDAGSSIFWSDIHNSLRKIEIKLKEEFYKLN